MANRFFPNYPGYRVTSPFGMRTLQGTTRMHNGVDLVAVTENGASVTDSITAHTGGTVAAVGYNSTCGYYIHIQCGDARMVYYHLKAMALPGKGETVRTGQVIGFMGATGNVTGAHLHFGIQVDGSWIDPAPYLDGDAAPDKPVENTVSVGLPTLRRGSKGETVRALQLLLSGRGCNGEMHAPDGLFGPNTLGAVRLYQEKAGLAADGIVGRHTWNAILGVR